MRERRRLEAAVGAVNRISKDMADAIEFIELGEAEGDAGLVADAEAALKALAITAQKRGYEAVTTPTRKASMTSPPR